MLACFAAFAFPLTGLAEKRPYIIVVTHGQVSDPFWNVVKNGVDQAAKDCGADVEYRASEKFDMVTLAQLIDAAVTAKPDGLAVTIPDADALGGAIQKAVKAGIPVISLNSGSDVSKKLGCLLHVGQDEYIAGKRGGERMKALGINKAVVINQEVGNAGLDLRTRGFIDTVGSGSQVLPVPTDFTAAREAVSAFLQKNPDIDALLTLGPTDVEAVLQALEQTGKLGKVKFATFDLSPAVLQAIDKKQMDFAIDQQQYLQGYLPVVFLTNFARYGLMPASDIVLTGPLFVTSDTVKQVVDLTKKGIR